MHTSMILDTWLCCMCVYDAAEILFRTNQRTNKAILGVGWPTSSSKDKLFPIPTQFSIFSIPTHRGSFFFSSGEHWQTAEILKLEIISSSVKMKNEIYLSSRRVVADTCHLLFKHQFCATLLNFKCPCLQMLQTFKLANFKSWQDRKESVFILWRIFLWKHVESKWNLFALKSPVKTHLSGDIVNVYVNRGHKSKPTM